MIIVAGEALIDLVIALDGSVDATLGGAPFNTARAASRLGADVEFAGVLSVDRFGTLLADRLTADGVGIRWAPRTELPTTLAAAELDEAGAAQYRFYAQGTSAPSMTERSVVIDQPPAVFFTGGLGLVLEPMADTVAGGVARMPADTLVMVDVNCRPNVIGDRAAYVARLDRVLARTDIVKASDDDLAYLFPAESVSDAAGELVGRGAAAVLVTAGSKETMIVTGRDQIVVPVPPLGSQVVDTIGAGDTFAGGLLAWWTASSLTRHDVVIEALTSAVRAAHTAAAVVVTRRGADPPRRSELPADWG